MPRRFRGPLVTVNQQTGDGRLIADNAISWAPFPLPFAWIRDGDQHINLTEVAPQVGIIDAVTREGDDWIGEGTIDDGQPDGAELVRRMDAGLASHGARQFVSVDPDDWAVEILWTGEDDDDEPEVLLASAGRGPLPVREPARQRVAVAAAAGDPDPTDAEVMFEDASDLVLERYTRMRIRGATACAVPAFTTAWIELVADEAPADDAEPAPDEVVAAARPDATLTTLPDQVVSPPRDVFYLPEPQPGDEDDGSVYGMPVQELLVDQPDGGMAVPFTTVDRQDGVRVAFGHAARWGQCHIGYPGQCVTAPESTSGYAHFHHGQVLCADGSRVATGPLTMGTDHAAAELVAPDARDHYANTGLAFADVRATNGSLGVWVSGVIRPDVTDRQLHVIRASSLSGDWRRVGVDLEFIGALAVNVPGFPISRELVAAAGLAQLPMAALFASAYVQDGEQLSLVASGVVQRCPECQRRAMAAREYGAQLLEAQPDPALTEVLSLVRKVELRTRHLTTDAAAHALAAIRR